MDLAISLLAHLKNQNNSYFRIHEANQTFQYNFPSNLLFHNLLIYQPSLANIHDIILLILNYKYY